MKFAFSAFAVAASLSHSVSACTTGVTDFTLIDAETDTEIAPLEGFDFSTLDLSTASLNVRANVQECSGDKIDSVRFFYDGEEGRCEEYTPYSWVGDENPNGPDLGDFGPFYGTKIKPGRHVLKAIPYPLPGCKGDPYDPKEEEFCTKCPGQITGFTLIDPRADVEIGPLDSDSDFTAGRAINVRADFTECSRGSIDSVKFFLDGVKTRCEDYTPYALFGDENPGGPDLGALGHFYKGFISAGVHTIRAIPYSGPGCTGTAGCDREIEIKVDCPACPGKITGFTLIDAKARKEIMPLDDFDLADLDTQLLNIRADFKECSSHGIESVQFFLDDEDFRCEDWTPYALAGDENPGGPDLGALGKFYSISFTVGTHTVVAVPFSEKGCTGDQGCPLSQTFEVA